MINSLENGWREFCRFRQKRFSLSTKIIMLTCSITLVVTFLTAWIIFANAAKFMLNVSIEALANETHLIAEAFQTGYDEIGNDAFVVSKTPPIKGIIRSSKNKNIDPLDGSTTQLWRSRLASIFRSIMEARPHYTQMRYIGVDANGREIVRVNRTENGLETVKEKELQTKSEEPYFKAVVESSLKHTYFSPVTYNREHGKVEAEKVPTIRAILPIFDGEQLFGMIAINVNYEALLVDSFRNIHSKRHIVVSNYAGDYLEHTPEGEILPLELANRYTRTPPTLFYQFKDSDIDEASFVSEKMITYFVRLDIDPQTPQSNLNVIASVPREEFVQISALIYKGIILISLALVVAYLIARHFIAPLHYCPV